MLGHLGWGHLLVVAVVGLFVFGPERLPKVVADAARVLRQLRRMAQDATSELKAELGPEMADLDLASLHPRRFVQRYLFEDDEEGAGGPAQRPAADGGIEGAPDAPAEPEVPAALPSPLPAGAASAGSEPRYDPDAT